MDMIYGFIAVASAGVAITPGASQGLPVIEYGALGLCGFMIWFLCKHMSKMHEDHKLEREKLTTSTIELTIKAVECISEITKELKDRMCLIEKHGLVEKMETLVDLIDKDKETKK